MSDGNHRIECGCGFVVEGTPAFVTDEYDKHLLRCKDNVPTLEPSDNALVQRAIADVSRGASPALRARLQTAAAELAAAGFAPEAIAARLEAGESV